MKKKILAGFLAAGMLLGLTACSTSAPAQDEKKETAEAGEIANEDIEIEVIQLSATSQINTAFANHVKEYAEEQGVQCQVQYHENNVTTMASMLENAVTAGTDAIILQTTSANDCVAEITKATEAGVIVMLYCEDVPDADYSYLYSEDPYALGYQAGAMAAKWANENLVANGEPVVAAVGNASVSIVGSERNRGIIDGLTTECPEAEVADVYEMAYKEEGLEVGENILQAHPDVNVVVGVNDQSICGVYEAFQAAGKGEENIGMFGIDGMAEALYYISQDTMFKGVMDIDSYGVGEMMVDAAIAKVKNSDDAPKDKVNHWEGTEITMENINDYKERWEDFAN